jgi:hypothetical protein
MQPAATSALFWAPPARMTVSAPCPAGRGCLRFLQGAVPSSPDHRFEIGLPARRLGGVAASLLCDVGFMPGGQFPEDLLASRGPLCGEALGKVGQALPTGKRAPTHLHGRRNGGIGLVVDGEEFASPSLCLGPLHSASSRFNLCDVPDPMTHARAAIMGK